METATLLTDEELGGGVDATRAAGEEPPDLAALRRLLMSPEQEQLRNLLMRLQRLEDPVVQARHTADVLPQAVALRAMSDTSIAEALHPAVEAAFATTLSRHPDLLAMALRRAIRDALRRPFQTMALLARTLLARRPQVAEARIEQQLLFDRHGFRLIEAWHADECSTSAVRGESADADRPRRIEQMLAYLQEYLRDPDALVRYLNISNLRVDRITYGIHASDRLVLISVIGAPRAGSDAGMLAEARDMLNRIDACQRAGGAPPFLNGK